MNVWDQPAAMISELEVEVLRSAETAPSVTALVSELTGCGWASNLAEVAVRRLVQLGALALSLVDSFPT